MSNAKDKNIKGHEPRPCPITCIARTAMCFHNQGHNNFKIVTLKIEDGKVVDAIFSDAYAQFDAIDRLESAARIGLWNLNVNWHDGEYLKK